MPNEPNQLTAFDFLNQIKKLDRMIENKLIEIEQWKAIAKGTTSSSETVKIKNKKGEVELHNVEKVQSSGSQDKMADAVARYVDIEKEVNQHIDHLIDIKKYVISVIEQLDVEEYDLLHKVYVQYITPYEVRSMLKKGKTWFNLTHKKALENVQKILDERKANQSEPERP